MLTNLSTILAHPLFQILKKYTYESQNTWHRFFAYSFFQILKKVYLRISKYLAQFFAYSLFQISKKNTYKSYHSFGSSPVSYIKKSILTNLKIPGTIFCLFPFSNIKKEYLQILSQFWLISFFIY